MRKVVTVAALLAFLIPLAAASAQAPEAAAGADGRVWAVIIAGTKQERTRVAECGVSIEDVRGSRASGIARPRALRCVEAAGFTVESSKPLARVRPSDFPDRDAAYHDAAESDAELRRLAAAAPELASVSSIGSTWQGSAITALRLGNASGRAPGLLLVGAHHAREHLSTEVVLGAARHLVDNRRDPAVAALLASREVWLIPVLNPDGKERDIVRNEYQWWRKNMRDNGGGVFGVDLNRNYGYVWNGPGSSTDPDDDTYRGPQAFSEPESRALRDFLRARRNIRIVVSYHSSGSLVLYPWSYSYDPIPDAAALAAFKAMGDKLAGLTGYVSEQSSELYASGGDTCDWAWAELKMFCFTVELPGPGFYPGSRAIAPATKQTVDSAMYLLAQAGDPYRSAAPAVASGGPKRADGGADPNAVEPGPQRAGLALEPAKLALERAVRSASSPPSSLFDGKK